ncbi:MAG: DUF4957 domain-containing protein [Lewinellaceae bacterium]|nr:DUF4957 domain-containing protein [Lewinellaceae bacterium]
MKRMKIYPYKSILLLILGAFLGFTACEKDEFVEEETRLFRPVLNQELSSELNTIIVNMARIRAATGYTIEVSRDSFRTTDHTIESDTNFVRINEDVLNGESLLWNTLYQVRATAHATDPAFDSKVSDLGSVRTQRFPTILQIPTEADLIDYAVRVRWTVAGAPVTKIRTFAPSDRQLRTPLREFDVPADAQSNGVFIVTGLTPESAIQIAIYSGASGETLRGWETYVTIKAGVDLSAPNVVNLTETEDPDAVEAAVLNANDGDIIVLKKGVLYKFPTTNLNKSITIRGATGFGEQKAILFTTGNWNFEPGASIDHVRFIDLELRGEDIGGDYVFNPSISTLTTVKELTFDNCIINNFRGIIRIRSKFFLTNYTINNCIVHHIGNYGIITADTDGAGNAAFDNLIFTNSTFSKINTFLTSRQNAQSILIDACTINELAAPDGIVFRWRGTDGVLSNVLNGITITNTIWGPAWDEGMTGNLNVRGIYDGLEATSFTLINTYGTGDFGFTAGSEIPGFPPLRYSGTAKDLWVNPIDGLDFNFKDSGFSGKYDSGDPRWRAKL